MAALTWDDTGKRFYETGVKQCALYVQDDAGAYPTGVAWSGISAITESPSGAEATKIYADDINYITLYSVEEYASTIEAYMYPDEFAACNGEAELVKGVTIGQQTRKPFGLCYKTIVGNDVKGNDFGYKLHLVYGAVASPAEVAHNSLNESPDLTPMSWEVSTTPVSVDGMKPTATVVIDSRTADPTKLAALEKILYGSSDGDGPRLPLPNEIKTLMAVG